MLRILIVVLLAIFGPYLLAAFVEMGTNPVSWCWFTRLALAAVYGFYLFFVISLLSEAKTVRKV